VTVHQPVSQGQLSPRRGRLTFNEQLCFFAQGNNTGSTQASFGWWATLALFLAIAPWVLVVWMIWTFA
jgi:hypothetical protein